MWDFWSLSPESLHQVTILMSDRGLPQGYRFMNGYGSHTYRFINAKNERFWVKFHFKIDAGPPVTGPTQKAARSSRTTAKVAQRDLYRGDRSRRILRNGAFKVQIMPEARGRARPRYNPFDLTKVWPHSGLSR